MAVGEISVMILIFLALKQMLHAINWDIVGTLHMVAVGPLQGQCNKHYDTNAKSLLHQSSVM